MAHRISSDEIYDLFVAPGVTYEEIAAMDRATLIQHVSQLHDGTQGLYLPLSDAEIAGIIIAHANLALL